MMKIDNQTLELALFALVALAMVVQAFVLLGAFFAMRKAASAMNEKIEELRSSMMPLVETAVPLLETSRNLVTKLAPRIDGMSEDVAAIAHTVRVQTGELQAAAAEMVERARIQASRLDAMLSNLLDAVDRAGGFVADTVNRPIRQINALIASAKAVVESLRTSVPAPRSPGNHVPGDRDMFI
jgi:Mg2+ and Co2+ transporter CorA